MNNKRLISKALSLCLTVALLATYSMTALAGNKTTGKLLFSGQNANAFVKVNGQAAQNGNSIFSSSTIATPEDASAIIDLGKTGRIELAPRTTLAVTFGEKGISGNLLAGKITVLSASSEVSMTTLHGKTTKLNTGESLAAGKAQQTDDDDDNKKAWWTWGLIIGGAAAAVIIYAATRGDDDEIQCVVLASPLGNNSPNQTCVE